MTTAADNLTAGIIKIVAYAVSDVVDRLPQERREILATAIKSNAFEEVRALLEVELTRRSPS